MFYPAPLPPIHELGRPELKLAGLRIDAEINAQSRMTSYATSLSIVPEGTVVPTAAGSTTDLPITGYPEGLNIHYVSWAPDSKSLAFTTMSRGRQEITHALILLPFSYRCRRCC